jgi:hypothetical protein
MTDTFHSSPRHGTPILRTRFGEWLLRREALARARATPPLVEPARALAERAREAANAGACLLDAADHGSTVPAQAEAASLVPNTVATAALELYREAAYWALRALATDATGSAAPKKTDAHGADDADALARAFAEAPATRLLEAAGSSEALARAQAALRTRTFEQAIALSEQERDAELAEGRSFAEALLRLLDARNALVPRLLGQRYGRLLGCIVVLAVALVAVRYGARQASRSLRADLAPSASWRVSSNEPGFAASGQGFQAPEGGPNVFFQTRVEDSPWVEFDLGAPRSLQGVSVDNRLDCCQDYAVPLVVELSDDAKDWREVARRDQRFYYWTEWFPESQARYLRLRVARPTSLQLGPIAIR